MVDKVMEVEDIQKILITTNLRFKTQFEEWLRSRSLPAVDLIIEPALSEEEKPGAVVALASVTKRINDDCLVVAGDNLFTSSLKPLIERFRTTGSPVMGLYNLADRALAKQYSIISTNSEGLIIRFVEKPKDPDSTLIGTAIYLLPRRILPRLTEFISVSRDRDSPGRFIEWLYTKEPTYGSVLSGEWWDIGTLEEYLKVSRALEVAAVSDATR